MATSAANGSAVAKSDTQIFGGQAVSPNQGIEVGLHLIDERARMWLGTEPETPHSVFPLDGRPSSQYTGIKVLIDRQPPSVYGILIMPPFGVGPSVTR